MKRSAHPDHKVHPPRQNCSALSLVGEYRQASEGPWASCISSVETFPIATGYMPTILVPPTRATYLSTPKKKKMPLVKEEGGEREEGKVLLCSSTIQVHSWGLLRNWQVLGSACYTITRIFSNFTSTPRSCISSIRTVPYRSKLSAVMSLQNLSENDMKDLPENKPLFSTNQRTHEGGWRDPRCAVYKKKKRKAPPNSPEKSSSVRCWIKPSHWFPAHLCWKRHFNPTVQNPIRSTSYHMIKLNAKQVVEVEVAYWRYIMK